MDNLMKDLITIVLQHLNENEFHDTARTLEQESGIFFNAKHMEEKVLAGKWEELEKYLLGFTKIDDNRFSFEMFFEIRKKKYLEAIDRNDSASAVEILIKDLRVFASYDNDKFQELCHLLSMDNIREYAKLRDYVDAQTSRSDLVTTLKKLVEANPNFHQKLAFPSLSSGRLQSMLHKSLHMQHSLCKNWRPLPEMETLLTDHECKDVATMPTSAAVPFATLAHRNAYPTLGVDRSFHQSGASTSANRLVGFTGTSAASLLEPAVATATCFPNFSSQVSSLKRSLPPPATPSTVVVDHDQLWKRLRSVLSSDEVLGSSIAAAIHVDDSNEENRHASQQTVTHCEDERIPINNEESMNLVGLRDRIRPWQLAEITHPVQCQQITVPQGNNAAQKVLRLLYTHSGAGLFALGSNGILTVWKWQSDEQNPGAKATTRVLPQQWKPEGPENVMTNEPARGGNHDDHVPCLTLSRNDHYAISAYGADVSLFNTRTFGVIIKFNAPPPATTCVAFYPLDNNIIAVGLDNSKISIYEVKKDNEIAILEGHTRGITGLAFSTNLDILISSGGDGMLCAWDTSVWMLKKTVPVNMLAGAPTGGETGVQFHPNNILFLVTQKRILAVYDASQMTRVNEWSPRAVLWEYITCAAYSGDGQLVYASLRDGSVWVLEANTLRPRCHVALSAYNTVREINGGEAVYPLTIAAHPQERNQFAIGLTDGSVKVMEPLASQGEWGKSPPSDE